MARKMANTAHVESIRKRLGQTMAQFSESLGYGQSAYADMVRNNTITETAALAAECLSRRFAPSAQDEVMFFTRIVRGLPVITVLDGDVRTMTLDGERFLLIPAEEQRPRPWPALSANAGNGAERLSTTKPLNIQIEDTVLA